MLTLMSTVLLTMLFSSNRKVSEPVGPVKLVDPVGQVGLVTLPLALMDVFRLVFIRVLGI